MLNSQLGEEAKDKRHFFYDEIRREYRDEALTKIRFRKFIESKNEILKTDEITLKLESDEFKHCSEIEKVKKQRKTFLDAFDLKDVQSMHRVLVWFENKIIKSQADEDVAQEFFRTGLAPYLLDILGYSDESLISLSQKIISIFGSLCSGNNNTAKLMRENKVFDIFIV